MSSYQEIDTELTAALSESIEQVAGNSKSSETLVANLIALIDGIPFYQDSSIQTSMHGTMANLMATTLPNKLIRTPIYYPAYDSVYTGSYDGYRSAFYHGVSRNNAAQRVADLTPTADSGLTTSWWGNYSVVTLTDRIREVADMPLDEPKLANDLTNYHNRLKPGLTATYQGVFEKAFGPTANPFGTLGSEGQKADAANLLDEAISNGFFTANINQVMASPPDGPPSATWFLYNLWVTLKALGHQDVNGAISYYESPEVGLLVPPEIGPQNWWSGSYTTWYDAIDGSSVINPAPSMMTTSCPYRYYVAPSGPPMNLPGHSEDTNLNDGYSLSFTNYGDLAWYGTL